MTTRILTVLVAILTCMSAFAADDLPGLAEHRPILETLGAQKDGKYVISDDKLVEVKNWVKARIGAPPTVGMRLVVKDGNAIDDDQVHGYLQFGRPMKTGKDEQFQFKVKFVLSLKASIGKRVSLGTVQYDHVTAKLILHDIAKGVGERLLVLAGTLADGRVFFVTTGFEKAERFDKDTVYQLYDGFNVDMRLGKPGGSLEKYQMKDFGVYRDGGTRTVHGDLGTVVIPTSFGDGFDGIKVDQFTPKGGKPIRVTLYE